MLSFGRRRHPALQLEIERAAANRPPRTPPQRQHASLPQKAAKHEVPHSILRDTMFRILPGLTRRDVKGDEPIECQKKRVAAHCLVLMNSPFDRCHFTRHLIQDTVGKSFSLVVERAIGDAAGDEVQFRSMVQLHVRQQNLTDAQAWFLEEAAELLRTQLNAGDNAQKSLRAPIKCNQLIGRPNSLQLKKYLLKYFVMSNGDPEELARALVPCAEGLSSVRNSISSDQWDELRAPSNVSEGDCRRAVTRSLSLLRDVHGTADLESIFADALAIWQHVLAKRTSAALFGDRSTESIAFDLMLVSRGLSSCAIVDSSVLNSFKTVIRDAQHSDATSTKPHRPLTPQKQHTKQLAQRSERRTSRYKASVRTLQLPQAKRTCQRPSSSNGSVENAMPTGSPLGRVDTNRSARKLKHRHSLDLD